MADRRTRQHRTTRPPAALVVAHELEASAARLGDTAHSTHLTPDARAVLHTLSLELHRLAGRLQDGQPTVGAYRAHGEPPEDSDEVGP